MARRSAAVIVVLLSIAPCLRAHAGAATGSDAPYSGDFLQRSTLTGDWGGARNYLAAKGITFDIDVTQITQGVVGGGKSGAWEYGGRGDLTGSLDTQKLGLWPGGFVTVELEGNWGDSVNGKTGALVPTNTNQLFPAPPGDELGLPELSYSQFFSKYGGVVLGKLQTISGSDRNEFAQGKGATQFFNLAFNFNPTVLAIPYSTLGVVGLLLPTANAHQAVIQVGILSATGEASTAGFDDLNGAVFSAQGRVLTNWFERTGHQLLGALYSNKKYTSLDQRLGFVIENRALAKHDGTWALYYNFDQYLWQTHSDPDRGFGVFGRFGASQGEPNPAEYFFSLGVGGKGLVPTRDLDQFGIGYYYTIIRNPTLQTPIGTRSFLRDEWGVEAYYNVALTPWLLLTPDLQVIGPAQRAFGRAQRAVGTATVLGLRLRTVL